MTTPDCERLDDYLLRELSAAEAARFAAHLTGCPECRGQLRAQRRLDRLLAEVVDCPRAVPEPLRQRIATECRRSRRNRTVRWVSSLTAAGVTAAVFAWWVIDHRGPGPLDRPIVERPIVERPIAPTEAPPIPSPDDDVRPPLPAIAARPAPLATVTFDDDSPAIAVPMSTASPNVTIYWVYPSPPSAETPHEPDTQWLPHFFERNTDNELAEEHDVPTDLANDMGRRGGRPDLRMLALVRADDGGGH